MKRASLNLSINAIVVLVLAITILGLGLGFIKSQFSTATQSFEVANQELETAIIKELETSGDKVTLKQVEFDATSGEPQQFYYGIKNNEDNTTTYFIQFLCDQSMSSDCAPDDEAEWYDDKNNWIWFNSFESVQIPANSGKAVFATLQPDKPGTYKGKLIVYKCANDALCEPGGSIDADDIGFDDEGTLELVNLAGPSTIGPGNFTKHAVEKFTMKVK